MRPRAPRQQLGASPWPQQLASKRTNRGLSTCSPTRSFTPCPPRSRAACPLTTTWRSPRSCTSASSRSSTRARSRTTARASPLVVKTWPAWPLPHSPRAQPRQPFRRRAAASGARVAAAEAAGRHTCCRCQASPRSARTRRRRWRTQAPHSGLTREMCRRPAPRSALPRPPWTIRSPPRDGLNAPRGRRLSARASLAVASAARLRPRPRRWSLSLSRFGDRLPPRNKSRHQPQGRLAPRGRGLHAHHRRRDRRPIADRHHRPRRRRQPARRRRRRHRRRALRWQT